MCGCLREESFGQQEKQMQGPVGGTILVFFKGTDKRPMWLESQRGGQRPQDRRICKLNRELEFYFKAVVACKRDW